MPEVGSVLPDFQIETPRSGQEREYLGIGEVANFSVTQVGSPLLIIEIAGVFCPQCHIQAPLFNTLHNRIRKNADLDSKVRMMVLAAGATDNETAYMKQQLHIPFPVLKDQGFTIHKMLGEPRTPFTMVVNKDRKVLFAHLGVINDMEGFMAQLMKLAQ